MQKVQIPFDGFGKNIKEAAEIISKHLRSGDNQSVQFIVPAQWAWDVNHLIYPEGGLVSILRNDASVASRYDVACFASHEGIGVTAYPC